MSAATTLSVKVSGAFAKKYRAFCEANCLQLGKFTEHALSELMEDYYFGVKAQRVLSASSGLVTNHRRLPKLAR
jgi:hypothetical protein